MRSKRLKRRGLMRVGSRLKRRYGHTQVAGTLSHLKVMEDARRAYRSAKAQGKTARAAHQSAFNSVKYSVGAGAWDVATRVQKEIEKPS